jgi:hypothetical protein
MRCWDHICTLSDIQRSALGSWENNEREPGAVGFVLGKKHDGPSSIISMKILA